jgi:hypothetical protein
MRTFKLTTTQACEIRIACDLLVDDSPADQLIAIVDGAACDTFIRSSILCWEEILSAPTEESAAWQPA